jgi:hypothetical protein
MGLELHEMTDELPPGVLAEFKKLAEKEPTKEDEEGYLF